MYSHWHEDEMCCFMCGSESISWNSFEIDSNENSYCFCNDCKKNVKRITVREWNKLKYEEFINEKESKVL